MKKNPDPNSFSRGGGNGGSRFGSRWFKIKTYYLEPYETLMNTVFEWYRFKGFKVTLIY